MVADAFVSQMATEQEAMRKAKEALEADLAAGRDLKSSREGLDAANTAYRNASLAIRKHTAPKPKPKAKAPAIEDGAVAPAA